MGVYENVIKQNVAIRKLLFTKTKNYFHFHESPFYVK